MRDRLLCGALFVISLVLPLAGCGNPSGLDSIQISPASQSLTTGQSVQFTVIGTYGNANHATTKQIASGVTFTSSNTAVVTVTSSGVATAVGAGTATITATAQAFNGPASSSAALTVTSSGGGGSVSGSIASIAITPGTQTIAGAGNSVQFIAIGTTSSGATINLTSQVAWISSATSVATIIATSGLATSVAAGTTSITALYTDSSSGSTVTGTATLTVTSAASGAYTALALIPGSLSLSASGQTGQLIVLGTTGAGVVEDVTDSKQIAWSSSVESIATVSSTGLVTGVGAGTSTITAELLNTTNNSVVTATATVSVSLTSPPEPILSLEIIPGGITVNDFNLSGQFIAIATYSTAPYVRDVTNSALTTWLSSSPNLFPVSENTGGGAGASAGIVTAEGSGSATIIAEASSSDGTIQTATATFSCPQLIEAVGSNTPPSCPDTLVTGSPLLSTLTVYQRGLNTTNWVVTAPSSTGTADVLHCGPGWTGTGGSVCTATYPTFTNGQPTTVVLTSPAGAGAFGGWSYNCVPSDANGTPLTGTAATGTAAGPNYCVVTMANFSTATNSYIPSDDVVGVIVN